MSSNTETLVKFNPAKVKAVRGDTPLDQFAENIGFKRDFLSKIERGQRKFSIDSLSEFCKQTNRLPNDFFDISIKEVKK